MEARTTLWLDGCFDGFHYAHANAVRQALYLVEGEKAPCIIVGVHSDKEIIRNKGPPLFDETERYNLIRGCRWIDQVIEDVPYVTQLDIIQAYRINFVIHGDDVVVDADGNDCYAAFKQIGRYKECKRTAGISTTSLIERVLRPDQWALAGSDTARLEELLQLFVKAIGVPFPILRYPDLTSSSGFAAEGKVMYLGGSWDCFGAGHVELLRRAKAAGGERTYLIVGVWSDEVLKENTRERPLLALLERALAVVQCRYSDALLLSPPRVLSPLLVRTLGIQAIVNGSEVNGIENVSVLEPSLHSVESLREKLLAQRGAYEERQRRKGA